MTRDNRLVTVQKGRGKIHGINHSEHEQTRCGMNLDERGLTFSEPVDWGRFVAFDDFCGHCKRSGLFRQGFFLKVADQ